MYPDFAERLKGFEAVWQRVESSKKQPSSPAVQPAKAQPKAPSTPKQPQRRPPGKNGRQNPGRR